MTLLKHSGVVLIESWARCACGSFGLTKTPQVSISFGAPVANAVRAGSDHHVGSYQQPLGFPNYQMLLPKQMKNHLQVPKKTYSLEV